MVGVVEVETFGPHLDVLLQDLLPRHVAENDVLWVDRQDGKAIGNAARIFLLLLLQASLEILEGLKPDEDVLVVGTATLTDGQAVTLAK